MYALQDYVYDADSDLKQLGVRWLDSAYSGIYGFPYYYDQDGAGKLSKAFSYSYSWRYTPQHDASETYASANALDQVGSITGNLKMPIIGYMASPPASETRTLDYDGNGLSLTSPRIPCAPAIAAIHIRFDFVFSVMGPL